jgi:hypothetical protein
MFSQKLTQPIKKKSNFRLELEFGIPHLVSFFLGTNALTQVRMIHPSGSELEICLHTGIVTRWMSSDGKKRIIYEQDTKICSRIEPNFLRHEESVLYAPSIMSIDKPPAITNWEIKSTTATLDKKDPRPSLTICLKESPLSYNMYEYELNLEYKISLGLNTSYVRPINGQIDREQQKTQITAIDSKINDIIRHLNNGRNQSHSEINVLPLELSSLVHMREKSLREVISKKDSGKELSQSFQKTTRSQFSAEDNNLEVEGVIAKRRRLEKERGQPAYFKYKVSATRSIGQVDKFLELGFPDDLHFSLKVNNKTISPIKFTAGLTTHFAFGPTSTYVKTLGLGLLPFLEFSDSHEAKVSSDTDNATIVKTSSLNRFYPDTESPNDLLISCGDRSHIQVIERRGFTNVHLWHPAQKTPKKILGFSPCTTRTPKKIVSGDSWTARVTFRWFPKPMPSTYASMDYITKRRDMIAFPPDIIPPSQAFVML